MGVFDKFRKAKSSESEAEKEPVIDNQYLAEEICHCLSSYESTVQNGKVFLPKMNITVSPFVLSQKPNMMTVGYDIAMSDFDIEISEVCSAFGKDSKAALGMTQGSFIFGIMQTLVQMYQNQDPKPLKTEFSGKVHDWNVYVGSIVGMGENVDTKADFPRNKNSFSRNICYIYA